MNEQTTATGAVERGSTTWAPGPWVATSDCESGRGDGPHIVISRPGIAQAVIATLPNYATEEAALIAAAPDLYDAIVHLRNITHQAYHEDSEPDACRRAACKEANAAIAKARGERVPA